MRILGKYELVRPLAVGGMGELFVAKDAVAENGDVVVLKRLKESLQTDEEVIRQFRDESLIVTQLRHPNIVTVHEVGEHLGLPIIVMEHMDGATLSALIHHAVKSGKESPGGLDPGAAVFVIAQIGRALDYAHHQLTVNGNAMPILHRDVNPSNILIDRDGAAKLIDFGIAKVLGAPSSTAVGMLKGTLGYLAPEQVLGDSALDHRTDQFQLGIVLWEALAGRHLLPSASPLEQLKRLTEGDIPRLETAVPVPQALADAVHQMLALDREDRFPRLSDAVGALLAVSKAEGWSPTQAREVLSTLHNQRDVVHAGGEFSLLEALPAASPPRPQPIEELSVGPSDSNEIVPPPAPRKPAPLVGRRDAVRQVGEWIRRTAGGLRHVGVLAGPVGSGKSTLLHRASVFAKAARLAVRHTAGRGRETSRPFDVVWQLFGDDPARAERALDELTLPRGARNVARAALLGDVPIGFMRVDEVERTVRAAMVHFVLGMAETQRGLCLLVDDAHWLDPWSRELIEDLWLSSIDAPLCLVAATTEPRDFTGLQIVELERFSIEDIQELSASLFGDAGLTRLDAQSVYDATEGIPWRVRALLDRADHEAGLLPQGEHHSFAPGFVMPTRFDDGAATRQAMQSVSPRTRALLAESAVLGPAFVPMQASHLLGDGSVSDRLSEAIAAGVLSSTGRGLRFSQAGVFAALERNKSRTDDAFMAKWTGWTPSTDVSLVVASSAIPDTSSASTQRGYAQHVARAAAVFDKRGHAHESAERLTVGLERLMSIAPETREDRAVTALLNALVELPAWALDRDQRRRLLVCVNETVDTLEGDLKLAVLALVALPDDAPSIAALQAAIDSVVVSERGEEWVGAAIQLASLHRQTGERTLAREVLAQVHDVVDVEKGKLKSAWRLSWEESLFASSAGDAETAAEHVREAWSLASWHHDPAGEFSTGLHLARMLSSRGEIEEAERVLSVVGQACQSRGDLAASELALSEAAELSKLNRDSGRARYYLTKALGVAEELAWRERAAQLRRAIDNL